AALRAGRAGWRAGRSGRTTGAPDSNNRSKMGFRGGGGAGASSIGSDGCCQTSDAAAGDDSSASEKPASAHRSVSRRKAIHFTIDEAAGATGGPVLRGSCDEDLVFHQRGGQLGSDTSGRNRRPVHLCDGLIERRLQLY